MRVGLPQSGAKQDFLALDEKPMQLVVVVKPEGHAGREWQCTGIAAAAVSVTQGLADMVDSCRMSQLVSDPYEVDCKTGKAKACTEREVDGLLDTFDKLCSEHSGDALVVGRQV